jgi:hypothetical protein
MSFNTIKNFAVNTVQENRDIISFISAILILYYKPTLYLTILVVAVTYCMYHNFKYNLDIDFKMRKNIVKNGVEYINLNESNKDDYNKDDEVFDTLNKSFMSDKIQTDTEIDGDTETESILCKSTLFE